MCQTLVEEVIEFAKQMPEKYAVCFRDEVISYQELKEKIERAAAVLQISGVKKGCRVLLTAISKPEYIIGLLAIQYLGAVAVPIDKNAKIESIQDIAEIVEPVLILTDTQNKLQKIPTISLKKLSLQDSIKKVPSMVPVEDTEALELLFTTGTTGKPKGAILTKKSIYANMYNTIHGIGMKQEDVILLPLPLNHSFGMRVLRATLRIGATVVLQNGFAFAKEIEKNIENFGCTALVSVPASMEVVLSQMQEKAPEILGKLRYIEIGAGALSGKLRKQIVQMLPHTELHNTWGSTESGGALFLNIGKHPDKIYSIGKPLLGIQIKIWDSNHQEIRQPDMQQIGRMALKGEMQMAGYWNLPEQTKETLQDGWLVTNDLIYMDEDGYVYMLGRADDIINVGGEKVSPVEVEQIASEYEGIQECACIGVKDTEGVLGQIPILYLVPNRFYQEAECIRFLSKRLEKYKMPQKYIFIEELPRNQMKKLDRKLLYRRWEEIGERNLMNPVMQNLFSRRSIRHFTDREIPDVILEMICKAGIYAPSGHNLQTWRFTVLKNQQKIEQLKEVVKKTAQEKGVYCYGFENPNCLILVSNDRRNPDGIQDASCAAENMMLASWSYGIGSVWLNPLRTLCDEKEIRALLETYQIPCEHIVWAILALGYPMEEGKKLAKKTDAIVTIR